MGHHGDGTGHTEQLTQESVGTFHIQSAARTDFFWESDKKLITVNTKKLLPCKTVSKVSLVNKGLKEQRR